MNVEIAKYLIKMGAVATEKTFRAIMSDNGSAASVRKEQAIPGLLELIPDDKMDLVQVKDEILWRIQDMDASILNKGIFINLLYIIMINKDN